MAIFNKNIDPSAAIAGSKLAQDVSPNRLTVADGSIIVGNASALGAAVAMSGDVTIANTGATTIGANKVLASMLAEGLHQFAKVTLTNAEIKALQGTPKELIAAPGAGKLIIVHQVYLHLDAGSEVLSESADNLVVEYGDGQDITGAIEMTSFIDQAADTWMSVLPVAQAASAAASIGINKNVRLLNTGDGEFAGNASNDATLDVYVSYSVADFS